MQHETTERLRIVVLGYIVRGPLAGFAWHHLQYVTCAAALGHEVLFVEDSGDDPACYDPSTGVVTSDPGYGLRFTAEAFKRCGVGDRWAYYDARASEWHGPRAGAVLEDIARADVLVDLCDAEPLRPWLHEIPVRALVDTDPVFTQVRHLKDPVARDAAAEHTVFFSFGEGIERGTSSVPDDGFPWQATRQPIDLDAWRPAPPASSGQWTTVMQWDSYPAVEHEGSVFGTKAAGFDPYIDLPRTHRGGLEIALGSPTAPRELLQSRGWRLRNPLDVSRTLDDYRGYLHGSRGEFSVAKHAYVTTWSGWFSERSACYLASGRPVVVQDTGFSETLPTGAGLFAFSSPDEALACLEEAERDPARQCIAARDLAVTAFDGRRILTSLLERALQSPRERVGR